MVRINVKSSTVTIRSFNLKPKREESSEAYIRCLVRIFYLSIIIEHLFHRVSFFLERDQEEFLKDIIVVQSFKNRRRDYYKHKRYFNFNSIWRQKACTYPVLDCEPEDEP